MNIMKKIYNESDIRNDYKKLTKLLIERGMTITTMESATSGQIASLITDTEGSSAVLKGAFVTYCNEAKIMQGVPAEILEKYTVYSKETAEAMAKACTKAYKANIGIGVTGTMQTRRIWKHLFRGRYILQLNLMERLCLIILNCSHSLQDLLISWRLQRKFMMP